MSLNKISIRDIALVAVCLIAVLTTVFAYGSIQDNSLADDTEEVNALIDEFQTKYSAQDASGLRALFYADAVVAWDGTEGESQSIVSLDEWILNTQEHVFDENDYISDVLSNREIHVFRNMAYAVCDYNYRSDNKTAAGVDVLTFMKKRGNWKIVSLQWTGDEYVR